MKVLQLCHKPPFPSHDGGTMAIRNLSEGLLQNGQELRILMIHTHKHPFCPEAFPDGFLDRTRAKSVFVDTKLDAVDAFTSLVNRDPYNVSRFFSPDLDNELMWTLKEDQPDVVQLESLFMAPYIDTVRRFSKARVVLRSHNLEHRIWKKVAKWTEKPLKKVYLKLLSEQLRKYEERILNEIDGLVTISEEDAENFERMGCKVPNITVPYGIDTKHWRPGPTEGSEKDPHFFHLGSMDWIPNQEAVDFLLEEVWPLVRERLPNAELRLLGKNMDRNEDEVPPGVQVVGEVEDAKDAILKNGIMLVPLRSGSGIRVRIVQGMALGKAIVSTSLGLSGIPARDRVDVSIADEPWDFAERMVELASDGEVRKRIGSNARRTAIEQFDENCAVQRLLNFYEKLPETVP